MPRSSKLARLDLEKISSFMDGLVHRQGYFDGVLVRPYPTKEEQSFRVLLTPWTYIHVGHTLVDEKEARLNTEILSVVSIGHLD
jgi:hypothetical protein